jgi:KUP system potassium uptake protein
VPLAIGLAVFIVLTTWRRGRTIVSKRRAEAGRPLAAFIRDVSAGRPMVDRVEGNAVYLNADPRSTPVALWANVERNRVLHEHVIVLTIDVARAPHVPPARQLAAQELEDGATGITLLTARLGFHDELDVPRLLHLASERGLLDEGVDLDAASYFASSHAIVLTSARGMSRWRKRVFLAMWRNAASPIAYFHLPAHRTVIVGEEIEL